MKKMLITTITVTIILSIYYCYQYTSMYLWFNSNNALVEKVKNGKHKDINFLAALMSIEESDNHDYDLFLLEILKQNLDFTPCKKCALNVSEYANYILNKKYPGNKIIYLGYLNLISNIKDNENPIDIRIKEQLEKLIQNKNKNKETIKNIINDNNKKSILKWDKIINNQ